MWEVGGAMWVGGPDLGGGGRHVEWGWAGRRLFSLIAAASARPRPHKRKTMAGRQSDKALECAHRRGKAANLNLGWMAARHFANAQARGRRTEADGLKQSVQAADRAGQPRFLHRQHEIRPLPRLGQ
ncbi:hypothetical protein GGTG_11382 [Gaeumannomyces tritici R3-111a-1]|uniref:Uncharacterized protein n=1 Tax=Gaeumannomyces tritici (strain R3-111a-1) TaxID=644352 RepID=J3PD09_GAET3|nr:hypothetical protein GGTG_11382 [Gaeumannomyces tritici R3-111a-1]EJT70354.1 hypothetical protein GGTG_11382 [Gaeumannomyces tritici R3-111a-1]